MEKIARYTAVALSIIAAYDYKSPNNHCIIDPKNRHFELISVGWDAQNRYFYSVRLHLHIRDDGKFCILENNTDFDLDTDLLENGVLKSDILPFFLPEEVRPLVGFAAA